MDPLSIDCIGYNHAPENWNPDNILIWIPGQIGPDEKILLPKATLLSVNSE
jgi:hypothetical protein